MRHEGIKNVNNHDRSRPQDHNTTHKRLRWMNSRKSRGLAPGTKIQQEPKKQSQNVPGHHFCLCHYIFAARPEMWKGTMNQGPASVKQSICGTQILRIGCMSFHRCDTFTNDVYSYEDGSNPAKTCKTSILARCAAHNIKSIFKLRLMPQGCMSTH